MMGRVGSSKKLSGVELGPKILGWVQKMDPRPTLLDGAA